MATISLSRRKIVSAVVTVVVVALVVLVTVNRVARSQDQVAGLPVTFSNATGSSEPVYIYIIVTDNSRTGADKLGWVDASGAVHLWPKTTGTTPQAAPDVAISGPAAGSSKTLALPANVSGRIYYSIGRKLDFSLVGAGDGTTGLIQPAPWNSSDNNHDTVFDWTEFTYTGAGTPGAGLWANPTQVDQFAIPATVSITGADGGSESTGALRSGGGQQVIDALETDPVWASSVVKDSRGAVLRILAPGHASRAGLLTSSYLDDYVSQAWSAYTTKTLTVVPSQQQPDRKFFGRTSGDVMSFSDSSGATVASFEKPTSADVWGCDGNLNGVGNATLPNDQTIGPISRTLCAALTRGTLGTAGTEPVTDAATYFTNSSGLNLYAKTVHAAMKDGRAYAFPFDDVTNQESLVSSPDPAKMTITLPALLDSGSAPASLSQTVAPSATVPSATVPSATVPGGTGQGAGPATGSGPATPATGSGPAATTTDTPAPGSDQVTVDVPSGAPGWAILTLGAGTGPGIVTIRVEGGSTSTAAVDGAGPVRIDLSAATGSHRVTISSTGPLGAASIAMP